jgi:hypothetical protein
LREFKRPLNRQPEFFQPDATGYFVIIASPEDAIYLDVANNEEVDLDEHYKIGAIKEIIYDELEDDFYIMANKYEEKLGFFIIRIDARRPREEYLFLTKWKNKLDIGDASLNVLRHSTQDGSRNFKELIISFKSININTYNVIVMDIHNKENN